MHPSRWTDPFAGLSNLHNQLDDMFTSAWGSAPTPNMPALDVYNEDDTHLVAEIQAPGFSKDDIQVNVHEGVLEFKGQKHEKEEDKKKRNYMLRESQVSFYRSIVLPKTADANNVSAHFADGVLKVTIPLKELAAPKKVAITEGKKK